jgi:hypothetical protein
MVLQVLSFPFFHQLDAEDPAEDQGLGDGEVTRWQEPGSLSDCLEQSWFHSCPLPAALDSDVSEKQSCLVLNFIKVLGSFVTAVACPD